MITANVIYTVKPGQREAFYEALVKSGVPQKCREEAGNIRYDYFLATDNPDEVFLLEQWKDQEALTFHTQQEHYKTGLVDIKAEYILNTSIKLFREE